MYCSQEVRSRSSKQGPSSTAQKTGSNSVKFLALKKGNSWINIALFWGSTLLFWVFFSATDPDLRPHPGGKPNHLLDTKEASRRIASP